MAKRKKYTEKRLKRLLGDRPPQTYALDAQKTYAMLKTAQQDGYAGLCRENARLHRQKKRYAVLCLFISILLCFAVTFCFPQVRALASRLWLQITGAEQDAHIFSYELSLDGATLLSENQTDEFQVMCSYAYKDFIVHYAETFSTSLSLSAYSEEADAAYFSCQIHPLGHVDSVIDSTGSTSVVRNAGTSWITVGIAGETVTQEDVQTILSGLQPCAKP